MPITRLYNTWKMRIQQLQPGERKNRIQNYAWLIVGILQSRSVYLNRIASKIPGEAKLLSGVQRLSRLLANSAIDVRKWYEPIAKSWLMGQANNLQQVRLIVDGTKIGFAHQLLIVSLAYRKRSIPLAWTWVDHVKGHSKPEVLLTLLQYVRTLLPPGRAVLLVGDTEFGAVEVLEQLEKWCWHYVLREKGRTLCVFLEKRSGILLGAIWKSQEEKYGWVKDG